MEAASMLNHQNTVTAKNLRDANAEHSIFILEREENR